MRSKRVLGLCLAIVLFVGLAGCGGASGSVLNGGLYDGVVQIGKKVVNFPGLFSTLLDAGAVISDDKYTGEYLLDADASAIVALTVGETVFKVQTFNETGELAQVKDSVVRSIVSVEGPDVVFSGGIKAGSALEELKKAWGEPSQDLSESWKEELTYCYYEYPVEMKRLEKVFSVFSFGGSNEIYSANGYSYTVTINRADSTVQTIKCTFVDKTDPMEQVEGVKKFTGFDGTNTLFYYSFPKFLVQNTLTLGGRCVSVLEVADVPYVVTLDTPSLSLKYMEDSITEEGLLNEINPQSTWGGNEKTYEPEILFNDGATAGAVGYSMQDGFYEAKIVYIANGFTYTIYENAILPVDASAEVTSEAMEAFEGIVVQYLESIRLEA